MVMVRCRFWNGRTRLQGKIKSGYYKHVESGGATLGQAVAIHRGMDGWVMGYLQDICYVYIQRDRRNRIIGPCENWISTLPERCCEQLLRSSFCGLSLDLLFVLRSIISDGQLNMQRRYQPQEEIIIHTCTSDMPRSALDPQCWRYREGPEYRDIAERQHTFRIRADMSTWIER
jgi:hypothetical protein